MMGNDVDRGLVPANKLVGGWQTTPVDDNDRTQDITVRVSLLQLTTGVDTIPQ